MKGKILLPLAALILLATLAYSAEEQKYVSPDAKYQAIIASLRNGESRVIVNTKEGKLLRSKSYGSEDGEHGYAVVKAAWTPNSVFFVYSLASSGGHQPWHSPIFYISVRDSKIRSLDDYIGAVTDTNFQLSAPDKIRAIGSNYPVVDEGVPFEVSLSELAADQKRRK